MEVSHSNDRRCRAVLNQGHEADEGGYCDSEGLHVYVKVYFFGQVLVVVDFEGEIGIV